MSVRAFGHIKAKCPSYKKARGNEMMITLTNDESSSRNQSETSSFEDSWTYMVLASIIKCETKKENGKIENLEQIDFS